MTLDGLLWYSNSDVKFVKEAWLWKEGESANNTIFAKDLFVCLFELRRQASSRMVSMKWFVSVMSFFIAFGDIYNYISIQL